MGQEYDALAARVRPYGLVLRGGFDAAAGDGAPAGTETVILIGNAGPALWQAMAGEMRPEPDPMNTWTRRTLDPIAAEVGAAALYPFGDPPYYPFQRWAQRAEAVHPSPLGILIHPDYGLWHAYRAAFCFPHRVEVPPVAATPSPCEACAERPCLSGCPVGAFSKEGGYDVPACAGHLRTAAGADCLQGGCLARRACPVGQDYRYLDRQSAFHMKAFLAARAG